MALTKLACGVILIMQSLLLATFGLLNQGLWVRVPPDVLFYASVAQLVEHCFASTGDSERGIALCGAPHLV